MGKDWAICRSGKSDIGMNNTNSPLVSSTIYIYIYNYASIASETIKKVSPFPITVSHGFVVGYG